MVEKLLGIRTMLARHGFWNTLYALALDWIGSIFVLRILRGVYVEAPDPSFLRCHDPYTAGFLPAPELREYTRDPQSELSASFLDQALARGDECYAIREGQTLAAYGWYSFGRTPVGIGDLVLTFDRRYVYMYKGFTDPRHRGQRLHGIGMTRAMRHYKQNGRKGLVSYVEARNFDSLKSCLRMGYRVFGSVYVTRIFGRYVAFSSPGCRRFDFRLRSAQIDPAYRIFAKVRPRSTPP
jgi:hypothetical protein